MLGLLLGTAQWGSDYGITNGAGRISDYELLALADTASRRGIGTLDTSPVYGDAEVRIGRLDQDFRVQTKISARGNTSESLEAHFSRSLGRLQRSGVDAVLVHDWPSLTSAERRIAGIALGSVLATGLASRGGISGYSEADLRPALDAIEHLGVVQVPVSVLDQRLDQNSLIDELRARGVVIQARSVFLQGAALDAAAASRWGDHPDISRLRAFAAGSPEGMLAACVSYIQTRSWIDEVVIGVTSALELEDIVNQFEEAPLDIDFASLASQDETLIDPRKW